MFFLSYSLRAYFRLCVVLLATLLPNHVAAQNEGFSPRQVVTLPNGNPLLNYKKSYALLIGVSQYSNGWLNLPSIPEELDAIESALKNHDFTVKRVTNPNAVDLENEINVFFKEYGIREENRLLIYFSGHGYSRKGHTKGYLIPSDAPLPKKDIDLFLQTAFPMSKIHAYATSLEARHALFMFDSCFSGTALTTYKGNEKVPEEIQQYMAEPIRAFITAGSADQEVPAISTFSRAFAHALNYGIGGIHDNRYLTGRQLANYLKKVVEERTGNTPIQGCIGSFNECQGDFIFVLDGEPPIVERDYSVSNVEREKIVPDPVRIKVVSNAKSMSIEFLDISTLFSNGMMLAPGDYRLRVSAEGYYDQEIAIRHSKSKSKHTVELERVPPPVKVRAKQRRKIFTQTTSDGPQKSRRRLSKKRLCYSSIKDGAEEIVVEQEVDLTNQCERYADTIENAKSFRIQEFKSSSRMRYLFNDNYFSGKAIFKQLVSDCSCNRKEINNIFSSWAGGQEYTCHYQVPYICTVNYEVYE